jgi:hypothetical protein
MRIARFNCLDLEEQRRQRQCHEDEKLVNYDSWRQQVIEEYITENADSC